MTRNGSTDGEMREILKRVFGADDFRTSQEAIITRVLAGGHSLVLMPTGMGKSLCYQLPALMLDGLTVVISPLIALMKDQVDRLRELGVDAACINSSLSAAERARRYEALRGGAYRLLYVAPERFRKGDFLAAIAGRRVSLLALDEAHCVSRWGSDFRPDYSRIAEFRALIGNPTTIALTATATKKVQEDIVAVMGIPAKDVTLFNEGICRPNLFLAVQEFIYEEEKFEAIHRLVTTRAGAGIVYFNLIKSIERFAQFLESKGTRFSVYHGKLDPEKRRSVQRFFLGAKNALMLATNAFGMGIDRADIRMIVHAEIPDSVESYYQEIGRAGRDGGESACTLMYSQDDLAVQLSFLEWRNPDAIFIKSAYRLLSSLGEVINSYTYEDLQEKLVYKHRADHRLQTVLNIFDRHGVTTGSLDTLNLRMAGDLPPELLSDEFLKDKQDRDRQRLIDMLNYVKTPGCRRDYIHEYFGMAHGGCGHCDCCRP